MLNTTRRLLLIIAVSAVNYFCKKAPLQTFHWVENRLQAKVLKYWALYCWRLPSNETDKILSRKICETLFFKNIETVVQRCSVKKLFLEISQNSQENACARVSYLIKLKKCYDKFRSIHKKTFSRISFFDKAKLCRSAASL